MMTVEIDESNGAGEAVSHNIANSNMGNADAKELVAEDYPITPGEYSYEKYQKIHMTALGGSSKMQDLKIWRAGALGGGATHKSNCKTSAYAGAPSFAQPVKSVSSKAINAMPTSEPASANLGIGGSLTGSLTAAGYSDYLVHQILTDAGDVVGSVSVMHYSYVEIA